MTPQDLAAEERRSNASCADEHSEKDKEKELQEELDRKNVIAIMILARVILYISYIL